MQDVACDARGVVTRRGPGGRPQTLVFTAGILEEPRVRVLEGGEGAHPFALGAVLELRRAGASREPYNIQKQERFCPTYDPVSDCTYFLQGHAIVRMDAANVVSVLAGSVEEEGRADGAAQQARFRFSMYNQNALVSDGRGALYALNRYGIGQDDRVCRVTASGETVTIFSRYHIKQIQHSARANELFGAWRNGLHRLDMDTGSRSSTPLHRDGGADEDLVIQCSGGMVADRHDNMYIANYASIIKMCLRTGQTTALNTGIPAGCHSPAILPKGCLALCHPSGLLLLLEGLQPAIDVTGAPRPGPAPCSPSPLSAEVLESPCVAVTVGRRTFHAHKGLLTQQSDYFKQLLEGAFAEGAAAGVKLEGADPEAFACLLRNLYSPGQLEVPDPLLRPVAELAGRLLLPDVHAQLQPRLLAAATPATVVADLLWAEQHSLTGLLPGLKAFFLESSKEALAADPGCVRQLIAGSPTLAQELFEGLVAEGPAAKRRRLAA